jgi:putative oxidoreductase
MRTVCVKFLFPVHEGLRNLAERNQSAMKKIFSTRVSDNAFSFAMLVLRVGAASILMVKFGYDKLVHFQKTSQVFADPFHIGTSTSLALVVFAEFFCSAFVILGLFTRLACIPIIIGMAVALIYAHKWQIYGAGADAGMFLIIFITLLFTGPGKVSLDRFIGK